jgi:hypothetical protein
VQASDVAPLAALAAWVLCRGEWKFW